MANFKLRLELKINAEEMQKILVEDFPDISPEQIFNFIKNNGQRFRNICYSAILNSVKQSFWTREKLGQNPADLAVWALKHCSPDERKQILYELQGVMN